MPPVFDSPAERIIAIGDIHGCSEALAALLATINPTGADVLVTLGDYVDRGPDSRGVIDQLIALQSVTRLIPLIGNHETMFLDSLASAASGRLTAETQMWLGCGGQETMESYGGHPDDVPANHIAFIQNCQRFFETDEHMFVHANYDYRKPLDRQSDHTLLWTHLTAAFPKPHKSGKTVIVGHTPQMSGEVLDENHVIGIDTFCVGTGWLTALDVLSMDIWQADKHGNLRT